MAGEGVMLHTIASLKANKRKRNHIFKKDFNSSIYTSPVVFNKSSKAVCKKTAQRVQLLKTRENMRLRLVAFIIFSILITLLSITFL